ncbi:response regulator [Nostoc sp. DSM 114161]|jgi:YesN/AraC family two-component response regulator|uniref:response regulator transcription factor n=1 Tax=Nostoc sp. DSM 114161 TaxID=3440143 RepID=UPI004046629F
MKKILVIENEVESRDIFLDSLEIKGFEAIAAENGVVGVQKAQEYLPDLVICDILIPKLDGYGVLRTLRQNPATAIIPFVFLTAEATQAEVRQGMNLGADDYLIKPFTVEEVIRTITARLQKQEILQQWYAAQFQYLKTPSTANTENSIEPHLIFPNCSQLSKVFDFIETNFHQSIGLCDVALAVGYSPAYLTSQVRRLTGRTVNRWIVDRRMAEVCFLLQKTEQPVDAIAQAVGYQNAVHFFRQFRQYHGTTPQAWRNAQRLQCSAKHN